MWKIDSESDGNEIECKILLLEFENDVRMVSFSQDVFVELANAA